MSYDNLALAFIMQFFLAPLCALAIFIFAIMVSSKYDFPSNFINIIMNVGIFTFPVSWIISIVMIFSTHVPSSDNYNTFWHIFPFAVVSASCIVVAIYIKILRTAPLN